MGSNWKLVKLGDVCAIRRGSSPRPIVEYMAHQGMPWVKISDATQSNSRYINQTKEFIKPEGVGRSVVVHDGDLILSNSGTAGLPKFMGITACIHDGWQTFSDLDGIDKNFLYYTLLHIRARLLHNAYDSTMKNLTLDMVRDAEVMLPTIDEQKKIAKILTSIDQKIENNLNINQTLEQMAQALFKSWFVDFDPVVDNALDAGFFEQDLALPDELLRRAEVRRSVRKRPDFKPLPDATRQLFPAAFEACAEPSLGLGGWVPTGWQVSTTGDEFTVKGGSTPSTANPEFWDGGDIHWTSPKDLSGNLNKVLLRTERKITATGLEKISSGLLPLETVLMSSRAPVGYLAITKIPTAINQGYIAITKTMHLSQEFTLYWLDSKIEMIKSLSGGTTFAEISKKTFRTIPIVVPAPPVVDFASKIIRSYLEKIGSNAEECRQLDELRNYLLPKLISGELEVIS